MNNKTRKLIGFGVVILIAYLFIIAPIFHLPLSIYLGSSEYFFTYSNQSAIAIPINASLIFITPASANNGASNQSCVTSPLSATLTSTAYQFAFINKGATNLISLANLLGGAAPSIPQGALNITKGPIVNSNPTFNVQGDMCSLSLAIPVYTSNPVSITTQVYQVKNGQRIFIGNLQLLNQGTNPPAFIGIGINQNAVSTSSTSTTTITGMASSTSTTTIPAGCGYSVSCTTTSPTTTVVGAVNPSTYPLSSWLISIGINWPPLIQFLQNLGL